MLLSVAVAITVASAAVAVAVAISAIAAPVARAVAVAAVSARGVGYYPLFDDPLYGLLSRIVFGLGIFHSRKFCGCELGRAAKTRRTKTPNRRRYARDIRTSPPALLSCRRRKPGNPWRFCQSESPSSPPRKL